MECAGVLDHASLGRLVSAHGSDLPPTRPLGGSGMTCPRCQQENSPTMKFCGECGTPLERIDPTPRSYADLNAEVESLRRSLSEALEQQTATSEILRVISSSPMDAQPTFEAIATAATTLCTAENAGVFLFDGRLIHFAAHHRWTAEDLDVIRQVFPRPPGRGSVTARAILTRAVAHVPDLRNDPGYEVTSIIQAGFRSVLSVPMLRDGQPIGAINVTRREPVPFSDTQIALLETFADQAVIAIENVRLFTELQARNQELTVALAQQTATSAVLAVISGAQTDVQPVFEAIVQSARRLCDASYSSVYRLDGPLVHLVAHNHQSPEAADTFRAAWPMPLTGDSFVVRAIRESAVVHTDMEEDPRHQPRCLLGQGPSDIAASWWFLWFARASPSVASVFHGPRQHHLPSITSDSCRR